MKPELKVVPAHGNQQGKLNLSRFPGQTILLYPSEAAMKSSVADLFSEPMKLHVASVSKNKEVYSCISADRRLVIVRQEIYERSGFSYSPADALSEEAYRRAFIETASDLLGEDQFEEISRKAWAKVEQQ